MLPLSAEVMLGPDFLLFLPAWHYLRCQSVTHGISEGRAVLRSRERPDQILDLQEVQWYIMTVIKLSRYHRSRLRNYFERCHINRS